MIARLARSRAWGKFFRNRMAVAGLCVIGLYFVFGVFVLLSDAAVMLGKTTGWFDGSKIPVMGDFTLEQADGQVGPLSVRGWLGRPQNPEKRLEDCKFYLDEFRKALRLKDKETALQRMRFAERRAADRGVAETQVAFAAAKELYDEVARSENLDRDPAALPQLAELESAVDGLFAPLKGYEGWVYTLRMSLGTDRQGRSIMVRGLYSIKVAIQVGLVVAIISVIVGTLVGAAAAYFGGWVDNVVVWLYTTLSSVPDLVLLAVLVFMFTGSMFDDVTKPYLSLVPVYVAMCATFWIGTCRVIRGEVMKLKELEYVQAATALGFSRIYILLKHVVPNTVHLMFINFSLLFIAAIKFEVILSFLGLGVKVGPSWGRMIQESTAEVIKGNFWQIGAATGFMFFLVLAFNIVSDALQDAFDPKHVG